MLVIRLGLTRSMQSSTDMPPNKKLKTEEDEPECVNVSASESESEVVPAAVDYTCDWRDQCRSLGDKYGYALKNSVLTDVTLLVGERALPFRCHRLILALGSPVFEAMFFGELAEKGDTVTIPDVDPDGFQHLIRFVYTGQCELKSVDVAFKTYFAADKYCIVELKRRCENHLCLCAITPSNVWQFFENSLFLNSEAIREKCIQVLRHQLNASLEQPAFLDINLNTMESLLGLDSLNVFEEKLLTNVMQWAEHQSEMSEGATFESVLKPLLSRVRFRSLTPKEFVLLRHATRLGEVLSEEDTLAILEHLTHPTLAQMPDWCCTKTRSYTPPSMPGASESTNYQPILSIVGSKSRGSKRQLSGRRHRSSERGSNSSSFKREFRTSSSSSSFTSSDSNSSSTDSSDFD